MDWSEKTLVNGARGMGGSWNQGDYLLLEDT